MDREQALDAALGQIERAFGTARVAGRLDRRGRWLFDVAHNPDGMRSLVSALAVMRPPRPLHALVSILGDKEWPDMLVQLDQADARIALDQADPPRRVRGRAPVPHDHDHARRA